MGRGGVASRPIELASPVGWERCLTVVNSPGRCPTA